MSAAADAARDAQNDAADDERCDYRNFVDYEMRCTKRAGHVGLHRTQREVPAESARIGSDAQIAAIARREIAVAFRDYAVRRNNASASDAARAVAGTLEAPPPAPATPDPLSASEAVYAFAADITTRLGTMFAGATHDSAPWASAVGEFCERHALPAPREGWQNAIVPRVLAPDPLSPEAFRGRTTPDGRPVRWVGWSTEGVCFEFSTEAEPERGACHPACFALYSRIGTGLWIKRDDLIDPARAGQTLYVGEGEDPRTVAPAAGAPAPTCERFWDSTRDGRWSGPCDQPEDINTSGSNPGHAASTLCANPNGCGRRRDEHPPHSQASVPAPAPAAPTLDGPDLPSAGALIFSCLRSNSIDYVQTATADEWLRNGRRWREIALEQHAQLDEEKKKVGMLEIRLTEADAAVGQECGRANREGGRVTEARAVAEGLLEMLTAIRAALGTDTDVKLPWQK